MILFSNFAFSKNNSGIPTECQTVCIKIRLDVTSSLIWIQTVCKCYQQTTYDVMPAGKELRAVVEDVSCIGLRKGP